MHKAMRSIGCCLTALFLAFAFSGCPMQANYPSTITPIYAGTDAGLWVFNGSKWNQYTTTNGLGSNSVLSVVVSGSGRWAEIYAGTSAGVSYFNGSSWSSISTGLGAGSVYELFLGRNLYAATAAGLSVLNLDGTSWTLAPLPASSTCIYPYNTYLYVATADGLFIYNENTLINANSPTFTPTQILGSSTHVTAILIDSNQDIIAGTDKGLAIQYSGSTTFTTLGLPTTAAVNGIYMDSNGNLYAAASTGLYLIPNSSQPNQRVLSGSVSCVYVDGAGTIHAGTSAGLKISRNGGSSWTTELVGQSVNSIVTTPPLYSF